MNSQEPSCGPVSQDGRARFMSHGFLDLMGKTRWSDVRLGDHVERYMTILFADLRGFTTLSEELSPSNTFALINELFMAIEPGIEQHRGFVDKFLGDGLLALFPQSADDAVDAALGMLAALERLNAKRQNRGEPSLRIGIGLNTGQMIVGVVGSPERMEGTVISDAVNLASRLEQLTKTYGSGILVSEHTLAAMNHPESHQIRFLDRVRPKGQRRYQSVYEVFDADPAELRRDKQESRLDFEDALAHFHYGLLPQARVLLERVAAASPQDGATKAYLLRCEQHPCGEARQELPAVEWKELEWNARLAIGVEILDEQHRQLYACMTRLMRSAWQGSVELELDEAWAFISRYVAEHFAEEERQMAAVEYPFLSLQSQQHHAFVRRIGQLRTELHSLVSRPIYRLLRLQLVLADWLVNHTSSADVHFAKFLRDREAK